MPLTKEEIGLIATRTADEVMERVILEREARELRDHIIGGAMGEGAIPLYGRETRREPCSCCLIEPEGRNEPENRMCTTSGAIGTLKDSEEREWCSEINIVPDGRCERARSIREAARVCKEKYPEDTAKFFECYAPAFSKITKGSNPGDEQRPKYYYCDNTHLHPNNEVLQIRTLQDNPKCPYCSAIMTYGRYWGPLLATQKEYVTITHPGKTTFKVGEIVSREAFDKENERVKRLGERPATGR